jgi:hypothetical protein
MPIISLLRVATNPKLLRKKGHEGKEMKTPFQKWITWYLVMAMFVIGFTPKVFAGFSPSEAIKLSQIDRSSDLGRIQKILEMKMVRERLNEFGLGLEEIQTRLNQLSDPQLHQLALRLDDLKVAGDGDGFVIALLLIAVIVVLIFVATGHRIVVK